MKRASSKIGSDNVGSSEIWSVKLKAHGVTEGTEVTQCHDGTSVTSIALF